MTTPVKTKTAAHRILQINSLSDLETELDRLQRAHESGAVQTTGNWSVGQILQHLATGWKMGLDGVDFKAPLPLRMICVPLKNKFVYKPTPRGMQLRGKSKSFEPQDEVSFEAGMTDLREALARVRNGDPLDKPSALFGKMNQKQWMALSLNHSAMHLGFIRYEGA